jgi:WASH complex subunit CCDC53
MEPNLDLTKLEPVPFKNTIGVLNEYILNSLDFINKFGHCSENKLYELEQVIDEIESKVLLLERKLDSIP